MYGKKCTKNSHSKEHIEQVLQTVQQIRKAQGSEKMESNYYYCYKCDAYHLTKMTPAEFAKLEEGWLIRRKARINLEAKHWHFKLGLEEEPDYLLLPKKKRRKHDHSRKNQNP